MRALFVILLCACAACSANAAEDGRSLAFSLGGFSGNETSGVAIGFYSLRPKSLGWYINGTLSGRVDEDEDDDFRPIPGDVWPAPGLASASTAPKSQKTAWQRTGLWCL